MPKKADNAKKTTKYQVTTIAVANAARAVAQMAKIAIRQVKSRVAMWLSRLIKSWRDTTFKEKVDAVQGIVTTVAILVGGLWTYNFFIKERQDYPHANIEQKLSHVVLSERVNLLRVGIEVSNTGRSYIGLGSSII